MGCTLACLGWGALSVPRKNLGLPLTAAANTACRCVSRFSTGRQNACGRRPPCRPGGHFLGCSVPDEGFVGLCRARHT